MISGTFLLAVVPLMAAALTYALRRFATLAVAVAVTLILALGLFIWIAPPDLTVTLAGRSLLMGQDVTWSGMSFRFTEALRPFLSFLYLITVIALIFAWRISQGRTFFAAALIVTSLASLILMVRPLTLAPLGLAFIACIAVFIVQSGRGGSTRGAFRQLWRPSPSSSPPAGSWSRFRSTRTTRRPSTWLSPCWVGAWCCCWRPLPCTDRG